MSELPAGWATATLGSLAKDTKAISYGVLKPGTYTPTGVPMLRVTDIRLNNVERSSIQRIEPSLEAQYSRTRLRGGEVVVSIQGTVGRVAIVPADLSGANVSRTIAVVPLALPEMANWVRVSLLSPQGQAAMEVETGGTTRDSLNLAVLREIMIPVPPLAEQARIAEKFGSLVGSIDRCRERLDRVPLILKRFRHAVLEAAVSGKLTEEWRGSSALDEWQIGPFTDFLDIQGGTQPPKSTFVSKPTSGYVRLLQIRDFGDRPVPTYIPDRKGLKKCDVGDVLLGRYGASVGRVCTGLDGAYNVALVKVITLTSCDIERSYLVTLLSSPSFYDAINGFQRSAQDGFNKSDLARISVAIPPRAEQVEIGRRVSDLLAFASALDRGFEAASGRLEKLTPSVLAKAFLGKLVPQDSNDEPAEKMLQRIQAERETTASVRLKRKMSATVLQQKASGGRRLRAK